MYILIIINSISVLNINVSKSMYDLILTMIQLQKIIFSADTERVLQGIIECLSKEKLKYFSNDRLSN